MTTRDVRSRPQEEESVGTRAGDRREATVLGALVAGLASGSLLYTSAPIHLVLLGSVVGLTSLTGAIVLWLGFSLLLGATYGAVAGDLVDPSAGYASHAGFGLGFGAVAALVAGTLVVPALGGADLPAVNGTVVAAYLLFGVVMGVGYGASLRDAIPTLGVGGERLTATVAGSLLGGVVSGALLYTAAQGFLVQFGVAAGLGYDLSVSLGLWLAAALVLGAVFSRTAALMVGRGSGELLGYTKAGLVYGTVAGILVGMVLVPQAVQSLRGIAAPVPYLDGTMLVAFVLYGGLLGVGYGAVRRKGRALPPAVADRVGPTAAAAVGGAFLGGVVLRAVLPIYFIYLGITVGAGNTFAAGYLVWLVLSLALGWVFARFVGPGEDAISLTRASVRRGVAFGAVVGGALLALLPVMYEAATGGAYAIPGKNPIVFVAYLLFGVGVGTGYGLHREGIHLPEFGTRTQRALVFGGLFGGFTGGLVIHQLAGTVWMLYFGSIVGTFTYTGSWLAWLAIALVLGVAFWYLLARDIDEYVLATWDLAEGSGGLLERSMERAEVTTTATGLGVLYGVGVAVVVGTIGIPVLVTVTSPGITIPLPTTEPMVIAGYVVYGAFLGLGYGTVLEF